MSTRELTSLKPMELYSIITNCCLASYLLTLLACCSELVWWAYAVFLLTIHLDHLSVSLVGDQWKKWLFGVVSGVGWGMGVLDAGGDRWRGRAVLGLNLLRPTVTNGDFVAQLCGSACSNQADVWGGEKVTGYPRHSCIRWGFTCPETKGVFWGFLGIYAPLVWMSRMTYFCTEMYSTCAWKVDNISVRTICRWNLRFIGFLMMYSSSRSMLGFESNWQKCNSWHIQNGHSAATSWRPSASRHTNTQ